jgi:hypothetical protein
MILPELQGGVMRGLRLAAEFPVRNRACCSARWPWLVSYRSVLDTMKYANYDKYTSIEPGTNES